MNKYILIWPPPGQNYDFQLFNGLLCSPCSQKCPVFSYISHSSLTKIQFNNYLFNTLHWATDSRLSNVTTEPSPTGTVLLTHTLHLMVLTWSVFRIIRYSDTCPVWYPLICTHHGQLFHIRQFSSDTVAQRHRWSGSPRAVIFYFIIFVFQAALSLWYHHIFPLFIVTYSIWS